MQGTHAAACGRQVWTHARMHMPDTDLMQDLMQARGMLSAPGPAPGQGRRSHSTDSRERTCHKKNRHVGPEQARQRRTHPAARARRRQRRAFHARPARQAGALARPASAAGRARCARRWMGALRQGPRRAGRGAADALRARCVYGRGHHPRCAPAPQRHAALLRRHRRRRGVLLSLAEAKESLAQLAPPLAAPMRCLPAAPQTTRCRCAAWRATRWRRRAARATSARPGGCSASASPTAACTSSWGSTSRSWCARPRRPCLDSTARPCPGILAVRQRSLACTPSWGSTSLSWRAPHSEGRVDTGGSSPPELRGQHCASRPAGQARIRPPSPALSSWLFIAWPCVGGRRPRGAQDHLLPKEYVETMRRTMLSRCPVSPFSEVAHTVEADLGAPPSALFASVEETPIASASLAQARRAPARGLPARQPPLAARAPPRLRRGAAAALRAALQRATRAAWPTARRGGAGAPRGGARRAGAGRQGAARAAARQLRGGHPDDRDRRARGAPHFPQLQLPVAGR